MSTINRHTSTKEQLGEALLGFGLSSRELAVFFTIMELGRSSAAGLAQKHEDIPRTSIYDIVASLESRGLISKYEEKGQLLYQAGGIDHIIDILESKKREIDAQQQELRSLVDVFNQIKMGSAYQPRVRFYEGKAGFVAMQREVSNVRTPICGMVDMAAVARVFPSTIFQDNLRDLHVHKVPKRDLVVKNHQGETYLKTTPPSDFRKAKWLPKEVQFQTDTLIWEGHVAMFDYSGEPSGVIIDNPAIYKTFLAWFEMMWERIPAEVTS